MTPVCIIGVILCLKPPFIFGGKQRLNTAGVAAAISQAFVGSLVKVLHHRFCRCYSSRA